MGSRKRSKPLRCVLPGRLVLLARRVRLMPLLVLVVLAHAMVPSGRWLPTRERSLLAVAAVDALLALRRMHKYVINNK
jgi:hypothetical protein